MGAIAIIAEPGNGRHLQKIRTNHELIPMNTWGRQLGSANHGPIDLAACIHPSGNIKRQIDYITANQKFRKCVRQTHVIREWRGNLEPRQHSASRLEI